MKDLCQKRNKLVFRGAYTLSGTGIVECLEIIDVGCNLKQFDDLSWLTLTPYFTTDLRQWVISLAHSELLHRAQSMYGMSSPGLYIIFSITRGVHHTVGINGYLILCHFVGYVRVDIFVRDKFKKNDYTCRLIIMQIQDIDNMLDTFWRRCVVGSLH